MIGEFECTLLYVDLLYLRSGEVCSVCIDNYQWINHGFSICHSSCDSQGLSKENIDSLYVGHLVLALL